MKIGNISAVNNIKNSSSKQNISAIELQKGNITESSMKAYPKNYYLSFTRNASSIYEIYKDEMPSTVREFIETALFKDVKDKIDKNGFAICHMLAFSKLEDCKNVEDVKEAFPNEQSFTDLKTLKDVESNGLFGQLKNLEKQGIDILSTGEDVTVFLVKKIYMECKPYKDVFNDFYKALSPQVQESSVGRYFENIAEDRKSDSSLYKPLGINAPNGRTYGASVRYTNPGYIGRERKAFNGLTAEETNAKIKKFLDSSDKRAKYSMIDAWNNCYEIRETLSNFMSERLSDGLSYANNIEQDSGLTIYDADFYNEMHYVMVDFWNKYPQYKEKLGEEVRKAHLKYDLIANLSEEELNKYINDIESKSKEIKKQIQLNKIKKEDCYPFAMKLMSIFITNSQALGFMTDSALQNIIKLLLPKISQEEFQILEKGDKNSQDFKQLVPEGLKTKLRAVVKTPKFTNISNAHHLAYLKELLKEDLSDDETQKILESAAKSLKDTVSSIVNNGDKKPDMNKVEINYNMFKSPLTNKEAQEIKDKLLSDNPYFNYIEEDKLDRLIKTQGRYLSLVLSENKLQRLTETLFWKEYDRIFGTDYMDKVMKDVSLDKIIDKAIKEIDEFNSGNIKFDW